MGWLDSQMKERRDNDEQLLEEAFIRAAGVVLGRAQKTDFADERIIAGNAIDDILKYYHYKAVPVPDNIETTEEQLDFSLRHYGIMRREIRLEKGWYKDATGPVFATLKESGMPVALLPGKNGKYWFRESRSGKKRRVSSKNEDLFSDRALCFYYPLPMKQIGIPDLLRYMKRFVDLRDLLHILISAFMIAFVGIINPRITKVLTGPLLNGGKYGALMGIAIFMVCLAVTSWLLEAVKSILVARIENRMTVGVQSAMMMRLMILPTNFFKKYSIGELKSRQMAVGDLCSLMLEILLGIGVSSLFSLLYVTQIFRAADSLIRPSLYALEMTMAVTAAVTLVQIRVSRREMKLQAEESGVSFAMISGIKKIRLTGAENRMFARWLNRYSDWADVKFNPPWIIKAGPVLVTAISLITNIVLYFCAFMTGVSQSSYYAFTVAYGTLMAAFTMLSDSAVSIGRIRPAFELAQPLLQTVPETRRDREAITRLSGRIEVEHLYFRYSEDGPYILNDISLTINPGEYVAIVGETGCGKSTLMRLLLGFETTDRGAIYYDGKDLKNIDPASLRRKIGTVMQQGGLFQGDIYSNIVISAPHLSADDAWEAAEIAGIAEDIRNMPMGMHTLISEGSGSISGGQKQRLMIARAVAPKPKILFLDEATSALDNVTQKHVSEALDQMGCTRIVIAHRLSTIRHCDRIVVLRDGKIAEDGTYEELIEKNGFFAELVERQRLD